MSEAIEIKGGASEFEAAVIAVVVEHVQREQRMRRQQRPESHTELPAWVRAVRPGMEPTPAWSLWS